MKLYTNTPRFFNDLCDEVRLFENVKRIEKLDTEELEVDDDKVLRHFFFDCGGEWRSHAEWFVCGKKVADADKTALAPDAKDPVTVKKLMKRLVKQNVYKLLKGYTGKTPPWGSLTGIRPTKLFRELEAEQGKVEAVRMFREEFDVSGRKTALAANIVETQRDCIAEAGETDLDIYIGIPFCVSRCKYCSFVSRDMQRAGAMKDAYLQCLKKEILATRDIVAAHRVRALYIGGGTPTALSVEELDSLLSTVNEAFPNPIEYTVEAGRPDTVTEAKLAAIMAHGAGRISINAQTVKQQTLDLIGRAHTVQDFYDALSLAREMGFHNINTDIILGLPDETMDDVQRTLSSVAALEPENITVHTLAIKNSSEFALEQKDNFNNAKTAARMVEYAENFLLEAGYKPYYLYRQKYMSGNLENVGFARDGHICRYNVDNMEETASVLAFGAGAISKRLLSHGERIERAANVKDIEHYISRTTEMAERKKALFTAH